MPDQIDVRKLQCGAVLVVEPMAGGRSASIKFLLPAGAAADPPDRIGLSTLLSEMLLRGAGRLSSREHSDALDRLGVQRYTSSLVRHLMLSFTLLGDRMEEALPLMTSMITAPALPAEGLDPAKNLCLQSLLSIDDDPQHQVMLELSTHHRPVPFNRTGYGEAEVLRHATLEELQAFYEERCRPGGTIIAAAGALDADALASALDRCFADWRGEAAEPQQLSEPERGVHHLTHESAQTHMALAFPAPRAANEQARLEQLGISVLGGGSSSRLFTEVRQKRSLCYSVHAGYRPGRDEGAVRLYAGTTPERAQETLDVCLNEIERLREGVTAEEFDRAVAGLKARLIMQGESTPARASAIAMDQYRLGRPRTLDEVAAEVDAVTLEALNNYLSGRSAGSMTLASVGPAALKSPEASGAATTAG